MFTFFDISKAFDNVWHAGLIYKMIKLKIPTYIINWVIGFLKDRKFYVTVNGTNSNIESIVNSTPQGAVLSPLLFNLFINDIPLNNSKNKSFSSLFADDLSTSFIYRKPGKIEFIINNYLKKLEEWLAKWRLKIAAHKCNYIIFCNSNNNKQRFNFIINNDSIPYLNNPKFLGITLDERLCFNKNTEIIKAKCNDRLNIIKILSHSKWKLTKETLLSLYRSLVGSIIEYSFFAISEISITNLNYLQSIQNQTIRLIFKKNLETSSEELHKMSKLKTVSERYNELNLRYMQKSSQTNPLMSQLIQEYTESINSIIKTDYQSTPLTYINNLQMKNFLNENLT